MHALARSSLPRLLPVQRSAGCGARRPGEHGLGATRPQLAVEPGADRARRGVPRLVAADARVVRALVGRDPGYGLTATFVALVCARERASNHAATRGGLQSQASPLIVYVSSQAHSSVEKAALLAGFGRENVVVIPVDGNFDMNANALAGAIATDRAAGREPCAIVATCGSTAATAFDPIAEIAQIARVEELWLHVDAAMAGSAMITPECRPLWDGIEGADSLVVNPHKWLGVSMDCSTYFVRDAQFLVRVMSTNPSFLQTAVDGQVKNYRDWGIPLGRRMRALKLWFVIREQGVTQLQARIRRDLDNAQWLANEIGRTPRWKIL